MDFLVSSMLCLPPLATCMWALCLGFKVHDAKVTSVPSHQCSSPAVPLLSVPPSHQCLYRQCPSHHCPPPIYQCSCDSAPFI